MKPLNYKLLLSLSFLIVSLAVGYYFVMFLPQQAQNQLALEKQAQNTKLLEDKAAIQKEQADLEQQKQAVQNQAKQTEAANLKQQQVAQNKSKALYDCLGQAHAVFNQTASAECKQLGYSDDQINNLQCILPNDDMAILLKSQTDAQNLCATLYK